MKKVLFMIHSLSRGGAEKVLVNLVNGMDKSKYDITVATIFGGGVNEQFIDPDIKRYSVFKKPFPGNSRVMKLFSPRTLHRLFVRESYDIEVAYLEGPAARVISGCPDPSVRKVCWTHCEQKDRKTASIGFRSFSEASKCMARFDANACVSGTVMKDLSALYPGAKNLSVVYNANDTDEILSLMKEPLTEVTLPEDRPVIIGIARMRPEKRFDRLLSVFERILSDGFPAHLLLLGTGPEEETLKRYVREHSLGEHVTFAGYCVNPYKYYAVSDIYVCPSDSEGFSTAASEALITGTPVVTMDVSGMREMLGESGEYGIIAENDDELYEGVKKLLSDRNELMRCTKAAEERGKMFSREAAVKEAEALLDSLG